MNVADKKSVELGFKAAIERLEVPPSLLVNAAGITRDNFLLQQDEKSFMEVLEVNVKVRRCWKPFLVYNEGWLGIEWHLLYI